MKISNTLKKFLGQNYQLIDDNKFEELFKKTEKLSMADYKDLAKLIYEAGLEPFKYIKNIPTYFFQDSDIEFFKVPFGIVIINPGAFANCKNLKSISFPSSLILISNSVFKDCNNLKEIKYAGTMEQWKADVIVSQFYNDKLFRIGVECSDGKVRYALSTKLDGSKGWEIIE